MSTKLIASIVLSLALGAASVEAGAAETGGAIIVKANMARILRINAPAATVIIGNPGVADVTIQDPQTLILTGKSYGQTNLIVLDSMGNPIADTLIEVIQAQADAMTVFEGTVRMTLACAPECQRMIMLGDDNGYTDAALRQSLLIEQSAQ